MAVWNLYVSGRCVFFHFKVFVTSASGATHNEIGLTSVEIPMIPKLKKTVDSRLNKITFHGCVATTTPRRKKNLPIFSVNEIFRTLRTILDRKFSSYFFSPLLLPFTLKMLTLQELVTCSVSLTVILWRDKSIQSVRNRSYDSPFVSQKCVPIAHTAQ